jgi:hypothetical protein
MRVRDHIALSTAGAGMLSPWLGRDVLSLWTGAVLIDADHYLWFCLRERCWNPVSAVRFFNEANVPQHSATRGLHSPVALLAVLLLGARRRQLLAVALGMGLHVALDRHHEARMNEARAAALERDDFTCQTCGTRGPDVGTHVRGQPWLLPSYGPENLVSLCDPCHEAAHANGSGSVSWK